MDMEWGTHCLGAAHHRGFTHLPHHALTIPALREQECSASACSAQVLPRGFMNLILNCFLMPTELSYLLIRGLIAGM